MAHRAVDGGGCRAAGVRIVTGDTKVVERGKGDGIFINTAGVERSRRAWTSRRQRARAT